VDDQRHRAEPVLGERIGNADRVGQFPDIGDGLPPQGIVVMADQAEVIGVDPHRVDRGHPLEGRRINGETPIQGGTGGGARQQELLPVFHDRWQRGDDYASVLRFGAVGRG